MVPVLLLLLVNVAAIVLLSLPICMGRVAAAATTAAANGMRGQLVQFRVC